MFRRGCGLREHLEAQPQLLSCIGREPSFTTCAQSFPQTRACPCADLRGWQCEPALWTSYSQAFSMVLSLLKELLRIVMVGQQLGCLLEDLWVKELHVAFVTSRVTMGCIGLLWVVCVCACVLFFRSCSPFSFLTQGFFLSQDIADSARMDGERASGILLPLSLRH